MTKPKKKVYAKLNPLHRRQLNERIEAAGVDAVVTGTGLGRSALYRIASGKSDRGIRPTTMQRILAYLAGQPVPQPQPRKRTTEPMGDRFEAFTLCYAALHQLDEVGQQQVLGALSKSLGWS